LRLRIAEIQKLLSAPEVWDFLWLTDFPLFEWSAEENKWNAMHHPFTRPKAEDIALLDAKKFPEIRAEAYDVVLNGVEIGGGSIRIHEPELQEKMFETLGVSPEDRQSLSASIGSSCWFAANNRSATSWHSPKTIAAWI